MGVLHNHCCSIHLSLALILFCVCCMQCGSMVAHIFCGCLLDSGFDDCRLINLERNVARTCPYGRPLELFWTGSQI